MFHFVLEKSLAFSFKNRINTLEQWMQTEFELNIKDDEKKRNQLDNAVRGMFIVKLEQLS